MKGGVAPKRLRLAKIDLGVISVGSRKESRLGCFVPKSFAFPLPLASSFSFRSILTALTFSSMLTSMFALFRRTNTWAQAGPFGQEHCGGWKRVT